MFKEFLIIFSFFFNVCMVCSDMLSSIPDIDLCPLSMKLNLNVCLLVLLIFFQRTSRLVKVLHRNINNRRYLFIYLYEWIGPHDCEGFASLKSNEKGWQFGDSGKSGGLSP